MTERTQQVLAHEVYDVDVSQVLGEYDDQDDFAEYDATLTKLQEVFGGRVFTCAPYPPGTVSDLEVGCPMFQDAIAKGFEYASDWLEMLDGRVEEEQPKEDIDPASLASPESQDESRDEEKVTTPEETIDTDIEKTSQSSSQDSGIKTDSKEDAHVVDERLGAARQEVADVFEEIETEATRELVNAKDADTGEVSVTASELEKNDSTVTEQDVEVGGASEFEEDKLAETNISFDKTETAIGSVRDIAQEPRVESVDAEASADVMSVLNIPDDESASMHVSYVPHPLVEVTSDSPLDEKEVHLVMIDEKNLSDDKIEAYVDVGVAADSVGFTEAPVVENISLEFTDEQTAFKHGEADETVTHIHELPADDMAAKTAYDQEAQARSYVDVLMNNEEMDDEKTESIEIDLSPFITKVEQETLHTIHPEVQAEVCAAAERAEQAATRLTRASTEEECHEARVAMTEEILTLLELLGYDNPREVMADILKTYDIGELRELLQHFLSSNRMAVSQQHDWISRVFSSIAARAILVHGYESLERTA